RVVARVRKAFGVELPLRAIFETPTVAGVAPEVEELRRAGEPQVPQIVPVGRDRPLPLSFSQERLWFLDRMQPGSTFYNLPLAIRLVGALDHRALERALGEIVRRHEALRTTFTEIDGAARQLVQPFAGFALPVEELPGIGDDERDEVLRRIATEDGHRPFDLSTGPLIRARMLRLAPEDHVLLVAMHHIVTDGWSMGVFFRELTALYTAFAEGRPSPLAELPVQYADYAVWQREAMGDRALERHLAWWRQRLAGAPALLELPTDHPRPAVQTHGGAVKFADFPRPLLDRLQALGRVEEATLFMVLLGAFQVLLSKYSGSRDVVVGTPIAGRDRSDIEELIGFFVNTLVLRTDLSGDPTFRELLRRVRETTLDAYEHQEVPFERVVEELQPERTLSHSPLFQAMFTLQGVQDADGPADGMGGLRLIGLPADTTTTKFDLTLGVDVGSSFRAIAEYSTDLFEPATIERLLGHLEVLLEQVAANPDLHLSQLELVSEPERRLVVEEWNRTSAAFPQAGIDRLFAAQAAATPDAVAASFGDASMTYRELDERSNRLARHLVARGVGPEVRVGLCVERGMEMPVSILAILKAGGAYVPLDPNYPAERLEFMLADSAVAVLVTEEKVRGALPVPAGVPVVSVDAAAAEIAAESAEP
ncbi:MAG TPA: condensation domain-containing protein, partial [Longimicrobiaceae bacterium]